MATVTPPRWATCPRCGFERVEYKHGTHYCASCSLLFYPQADALKDAVYVTRNREGKIVKETQTRKYPAIDRFLGWWLVMKSAGETSVSQIVEVHDVYVKVHDANGEDTIATSAVFDSRIAQLYPSRRLAMEAAARR